MRNSKAMITNNNSCCGDRCGKCCGGGCSGCGTIELTRKKIGFLLKFAQLPFLPVAAAQENGDPVYIEEGTDTAENSIVIKLLAAKKLISVDLDVPLSNYDYSEYKLFPVHGSMALAQRGQQAIDQIEMMEL